MKAVLDVSAAIAVALKKKGYQSIRNAISTCDHVIAPELFQSEAANTLWKYVHFENFEYKYATELLDVVLGMVDDYVPVSENINEAFFEATRLKHPVYDLLYLTLARRNNAALISHDKKLSSQAAKLGIAIYYEK